MPTAHYTADGGHYRVGGIGFDPGDVYEVDGDLAEHLEGVDDFDITYEAPGDGERLTGEDVEYEKKFCEVIKSDDEVCGRELPCRYHSDGEED